MSEHSTDLALEDIVDQCLDEIASGRLSAADALARWPEHREALAPLLDVASAIRELPPVTERAPDPERRAGFMAAIATTPQQQPNRGLTERVGAWLSGVTTAAPRIAAVAAPAAAIAVVAVLFVMTSGGERAAASTLTVFDGAVERHDDGVWTPITDGAELNEGDQLRTTASGVALVTFADGSTAALDPETEVILEEITTGESRRITLEQLAGRVWNDVAPDGGPATYVVRTADALIEAHGTTFETTVADGATSVVTASGLVEVAAGTDRAMVEPGQVLRAVEQRIVDALPHATSDMPSTLRIDGPFVASLRSETGAATGALPNGVTYHQIPGVGTTNPGDGPQILRFYDIAPGRYELVLRRIDGPRAGGTATLTTDGRTRGIELPPGLATMTIRIDIGIDGGIVRIELVDREPVATDVADPERIADTPRISDAVAVSDQRAAAAPVRPSDAARPSPTSVSDRQPTPTASDAAPSATATQVRDRLLAILDLEGGQRSLELRRFLESFERDDARWQLLRQRLEADAALRRRFVEALVTIDAPAFVEFVRGQLALAAPADRSDATPEATTTTMPSDQPDAVATRTAMPAPTDEALRDSR